MAERTMSARIRAGLDPMDSQWDNGSNPSLVNRRKGSVLGPG